MCKESEYYSTACAVNVITKAEQKEREFFYVLYINYDKKYMRRYRSNVPMGQYTDYSSFCDKVVECYDLGMKCPKNAFMKMGVK